MLQKGTEIKKENLAYLKECKQKDGKSLEVEGKKEKRMKPLMDEGCEKDRKTPRADS